MKLSNLFMKILFCCLKKLHDITVLGNLLNDQFLERTLWHLPLPKEMPIALVLAELVHMIAQDNSC